ncbi:glycosyltransferase [Algoriphagus pacificus]|uniref:Glycosyltransferase family 2 protein n=1 Tax=Algoriphagus pacificus TaxID=2811234 RepID=A0ABS3CPJ6_9BACT|nr:glycosyltransferase family A protein [Algoriphagus pacificus]MBN7817584.1 glycosyltransferase family 2 protein [Algoriphagus pacificus]
MDDILISIIIPTYKDWDSLRLTLDAIQNQKKIDPSLIEVLVVDNDPDSVFPEDFTLSQNIKILKELKKGAYASRNKGLKVAKGKIIVFTDSDCIPEPNWLENGVRLLQDGADMVGGKMIFFKSPEGDEETYLFEKIFSFNQKRNVLQNQQSITANLFVTSEVVQSVGEFEENLLSGGDFLWTKKATSQGFKLVYGEDVVVNHPARLHFESLIKKKKRTSGGMYFKFFKGFSFFKKLKFTLHILRPPITIFTFPKLTFSQKLKLFRMRWYLEWVGVKELLKLTLTKKQAERS